MRPVLTPSLANTPWQLKMSPTWVQYCLGSVGWITLPVALYSCAAEQTTLKHTHFFSFFLFLSLANTSFLCVCFQCALSLSSCLLSDSLQKSSPLFLYIGFSLLFYISLVVEQVFWAPPPIIPQREGRFSYRPTAPRGRAPEGGQARRVTRWGQMKWIGCIYGGRHRWKSVRVI